MPLYVTVSGNTIEVFPGSNVLSNIDKQYCSYYTSGSNVFPTVERFLSYHNFPAVKTNILDGLSNIQTKILSSNVEFSYTSPLSNYLNTMRTDMLSLAFVANCVKEQTAVNDALYSAKKTLEVSKDRYEQLHSPETHVSYYEGTFPIYRPIGQTTLFSLFGVGLFLMLVSLLFFLRTQGIEIQLVMPQTFTVSGSSVYTTLVGQGMYIGIASVIGIVLGYFLHVYYKE
jgi:hypothetical protein